LITGESANQSTNLRAANLPAVRVKPANRRHLIGGSDARVIMCSDNATLLRLSGEPCSDEPEDLLKCRYSGANAGQAPVASNIAALFYANAGFFLGRLLRRIVLTLLLFVSRNKRLRISALGKVSSNQLVRLKAQEKRK
jgi:hypothetical protein